MVLASFDITQAALTRYKVAGYPPDVMIEVPKTICGAYEFHRAEALIALGRHLAVQALEHFEGRGIATTGVATTGSDKIRVAPTATDDPGPKG
jgi:NTE family protein